MAGVSSDGHLGALGPEHLLTGLKSQPNSKHWSQSGIWWHCFGGSDWTGLNGGGVFGNRELRGYTFGICSWGNWNGKVARLVGSAQIPDSRRILNFIDIWE